MLGVLEDKRDVVVEFLAWVLAHMPVGRKAPLYGLSAGFYAVVGYRPPNSVLAPYVHDRARLIHT